MLTESAHASTSLDMDADEGHSAGDDGRGMTSPRDGVAGADDEVGPLRDSARRAMSREDAVLAKTRSVGDALQGATTWPEDVLGMLVGALPHCLAIPKEERHAVQEDVIKMVEQVLDSIVATKEAAFAEAKAKAKAKEAAAAEGGASVEAARATAAAKAAAAAAAQSRLQRALEPRATEQAALNAAISEQQHDDASCGVAAAEKAALEAALVGDFASLEAGAAELLLTFAEQRSFETHFLRAAQHALRKARADRGNFDVLVVDHFKAQLTGHIELVAEQLASMEAGKSERQATVDSCAAAFEGAEASLAECEGELSAALEEEKEAKATLKCIEAEAKTCRLHPAEALELSADEAAAELTAVREAVRAFAELESRVPAVEEAAQLEVGPSSSGGLELVLALSPAVALVTRVRRRLHCSQAPTLTLSSPKRRLRGKQNRCGQRQQHGIDDCAVEIKEAYEYLGLALGAGASEIKAAYRRSALRDHSDKGGSDDAFRETHSAYEKLMKYAVAASKTFASSGSRTSASVCSPEVFRWSLLELRPTKWAQRLRTASTIGLEETSRWLSSKAAGLTADDLLVYTDRRGQCVGRSNIYREVMRGVTYYRVEISRHRLRCSTPVTTRWEDVIRWQADVSEVLLRLEQRISEFGVDFYVAAQALSCNVLLKFQSCLRIEGAHVISTPTFDLHSALELRKKMLAVGASAARILKAEFGDSLRDARRQNREPGMLALLQKAVAGELHQRHLSVPFPRPLSAPVPLPLAFVDHRPRKLRRNEQENAAIRSHLPDIDFHHLESALKEITWPQCESRKKVMPEGVKSVSAFAMGLVAARFTQEPVCTRTLAEWPQLAQLVTSFINRHADHRFDYTTVQFNREYAAALHTDLNNEGPSYIVGLGTYSGGELWLYDPDGPVHVEVRAPIPGWPSARAGSSLPGRLVDIRNRLVPFNGKLPHMVWPYQGSRTSIVWFTTKKWRSMSDKDFARLRGCLFRLPTEKWKRGVAPGGGQKRKAAPSSGGVGPAKKRPAAAH